jgi:multidrug efflux pump subunit AcrA (membrane-fusion protein)
MRTQLRPSSPITRRLLSGLALSFVLLLTAACSGNATPSPTVTPSAAQNPAESRSVVASAEVVPAQDARLAFVIPGTIKAIAVKEGDIVQAGQLLAALNAPDLEYAVTQAEAGERAAEFEYEYWIPARLDRPPERRQLAEQELVVARLELETARAALTQAALTAPFDGAIVKIEAVPGELVQPHQVVITIAALDRLLIETTDLSERDVSRLENGMNATVSVEALGAELPARVTAIAPRSNTVGGDVVYRVTLELEDQPSELMWGMSAEVRIDVPEEQ